MNYTMTDVKNSMPKIKATKDALWVKMWVRPLSYPLSALALNLGITPNTISVVSIIDTLIACVLMCFNNKISIIVGFVLLNLFILFDCMDGTMARTLKRSSYMGEFYDAVGGYTICAFSLLAGGVCAYQTGMTCYINNDIMFLIVLPAVASVCDVFARLIYQKYTVSELVANYKKGLSLHRENDDYETVEKAKISITYLRNEIDRQFGTGGFFPPLLAISYFAGFMDVVVIIYSLYHILAWVAVAVIFCRKATIYDSNN